MSGANVQKGKALENFIADELRAKGIDHRARRQIGSGNGKRKGDIDNDIGLCIEAKNQQNANIGPTMRQVRREAMGTQQPVIVWHVPDTPFANSMVIIDWDYFIDLLLAKKNNASTGEILDRYRLRDKLKTALLHLKKRPDVARAYINEVIKNV